MDGIVTGTLDQIGDSLLENDVQFAYFQEPDLNDALTALCFIVDERVFNKEDYPDFVKYLVDNCTRNVSTQRIIEIRMTPYEELKLIYPDLDIIPLKENYDGSSLEPITFLPLLPLVLLNGIEGIAVG